jgi:hypothetical protein
MFCPECGQQHSLPNVRFCTQCGFQLGVVSALLTQAQSRTTGQLMPSAPRRPLFKRGALLGATLMWIIALFTALVVGGTRDDDMAVAATFFWLILMLIILLSGPVARLAKRLFTEEDSAQVRRYAAPQVSVSLPPSGLATNIEPPRTQTGERFRTPSVVEHTTRTLGKGEQI